MISVTNPKIWESTKTGSLSGHCESCIKSIHEANVLAFGTNKAMVLCFVTEISMSLALLSEPQLALQGKICQM